MATPRGATELSRVGRRQDLAEGGDKGDDKPSRRVQYKGRTQLGLYLGLSLLIGCATAPSIDVEERVAEE